MGGIWWFFTLIIISSYTANLAAFLTVERMVSPIETADDLVQQHKIKYGTIDGGSTMTFFRESKIPTYQRLWSNMNSNSKQVFVSKSEVGIEKVLQGNYAFFMENTMIDYAVQRHCDLMQVGGLLDSKGYGIGMPIGSFYRDQISMAILNLQENGKIQVYYNNWWKGDTTCNKDDKKDSKASSLGVANVGGIFVVLMVGLCLAIITAIIEFVWNSRKNARHDRVNSIMIEKSRKTFTPVHAYKQSLCSEMGEELRFAIRCHGSTKKPALRRQCSRCVPTAPDACTIDSPNGRPTVFLT